MTVSVKFDPGGKLTSSRTSNNGILAAAVAESFLDFQPMVQLLLSTAVYGPCDMLSRDLMIIMLTTFAPAG